MRKYTRTTSNLSMAMALSASLILAGCFDDPGSKPFTAGTDATNQPTATNRAPAISGSAPTKVNVGQSYDFAPTASDPDGDRITFSASGVPAWLSFDPGTGRLSGTPSARDVASYRGIRITASDGKTSASLTIAKLDVTAASPGTPAATGSATLDWEAPTANADGTPLTDLAGYKIRYGTNPGSLDQVIDVNNPGLTTYVVEDLAPATWYFAISSVNSEGVESQATGVVWTTIG